MRGLVWTGELEVRDDVEVRAAAARGRGAHRQRLCHSDVSVLDGTIPFPTPVVLGHEGAGVVERWATRSARCRWATTWSSPPPGSCTAMPATAASPPTAATRWAG